MLVRNKQTECRVDSIIEDSFVGSAVKFPRTENKQKEKISRTFCTNKHSFDLLLPKLAGWLISWESFARGETKVGKRSARERSRVFAALYSGMWRVACCQIFLAGRRSSVVKNSHSRVVFPHILRAPLDQYFERLLLSCDCLPLTFKRRKIVGEWCGCGSCGVFTCHAVSCAAKAVNDMFLQSILTSVWKVQNKWHKYGCFVPNARTLRSISVHSTSSSSKTTSFFKHFTA